MEKVVDTVVHDMFLWNVMYRRETTLKNKTQIFAQSSQLFFVKKVCGV